MPALYSIALLIAFYALVIAEILIPSGGLLAISAAVVAVTSVIIASTYSLSLALTLTLVYLVTTPILFAILIHLWPKTKIGRVMLNRETLESDTTPPPPTTFDGTPLAALVGKIGVATTNLLPGGQIKIEGHKSDAVSTGLPIDAGSIIVVTRLHAGKLQVRLASAHEKNALQTSDANQHVSGTDNGALRPTLRPQPAAACLAPPEKPPATSLLDDVDFDQLANDEPIPDPSHHQQTDSKLQRPGDTMYRE